MARVSIEDCLDHIDNRFALVSVASDRARQLMKGVAPLVKSSNKEAVRALREIAEGFILAKRPEQAPEAVESASAEKSNPLEAVLSSDS